MISEASVVRSKTGRLDMKRAFGRRADPLWEVGCLQYAMEAWTYREPPVVILCVVFMTSVKCELGMGCQNKCSLPALVLLLQ